MTRRMLLVLCAALALTAGGIAYASIPDSGGVIHTCYTKSGGTLRVIDDSVTKCKSNETALPISQTGPKGDTGATGPTEGVGSTPVAPGVTPPATLTSELSASQTAQLRSSFTTTVSGKLHLSKAVTARTDCESLSSVFWWIILDGTAVQSSITAVLDFNWVTPTLTGVTDSVISAGNHEMTLGAMCLNAGTNEFIVFPTYSRGTAIVLG
jgi:hypothetical protein